MGKTRGVREVEVDNKDRKDREQDVEAEITKANICIVRINLSIAIPVPKEDMLLKYGLVDS
jgi:hypothetical protein